MDTFRYNHYLQWSGYLVRGHWFWLTNSWYPPPTGQVSSGTVFYPTSSTTYTVVGSFNSLNTCTNSATQLITVNPKPALVAFPPAALCYLSRWYFTVFSNGATTINWQPVGLNGNPLTVSPGSTTIYISLQHINGRLYRAERNEGRKIRSVPTIGYPPLICTGY